VPVQRQLAEASQSGRPRVGEERAMGKKIIIETPLCDTTGSDPAGGIRRGGGSGASRRP